jgi:hypothetical protein
VIGQVIARVPVKDHIARMEKNLGASKSGRAKIKKLRKKTKPEKP